MAKRITVVDGITVASQLTWRWEDYPGLSRWAQSNHTGPQHWRTFPGCVQKKRRPTEAGADRCYIPGFEERGRRSLEAGKGKEAESSPRAPGKKAALPTP